MIVALSELDADVRAVLLLAVAVVLFAAFFTIRRPERARPIAWGFFAAGVGFVILAYDAAVAAGW